MVRRAWGLAAVWALGAILASGCGGESAAPSAAGGGGHGGSGGGGETGGGGPALVAEAGFFDAPRPLSGPESDARMFYSFHPADEGSVSAPLVVFFNGGPGAATTGFLFPFGTGPMTLDAADAGALVARPNASSWTRFANVLHVDARSTGFSYALGDPGCNPGMDWQSATGQEILYLVDAADFVRALLDFLDAHPAIVANPVVVVGESYGGQRAIFLEHFLLHYDEPLSPDLSFPFDVASLLPWLHDRVQQHVNLAFPELHGGAASVEQMKRQFGATLFIEPGFGSDDFNYEQTAASSDPLLGPKLARSGTSRDDVRQKQADEDDLEARDAAAIRDPETLASLLGVKLDDVRELAAPERTGAQREFAMGGDTETLARADEAALRRALGELQSGDAYWLIGSTACPFFGDSEADDVAIRTLPELRVFMTHARYDANIYTPGLFDWMQKERGIGVAIDMSSPTGAPRPGVVNLTNVGARGVTATLRWPTYEAGHEVTLTQPAELADDAEAWLRSEGIL